MFIHYLGTHLLIQQTLTNPLLYTKDSPKVWMKSPIRHISYHNNLPV